MQKLNLHELYDPYDEEERKYMEVLRHYLTRLENNNIPYNKSELKRRLQDVRKTNSEYERLLILSEISNKLKSYWDNNEYITFRRKKSKKSKKCRCK